MSRLIQALLALVALANLLVAQESPVRRLPVTVVSIDAGFVRLDQGRQADVQVGDRVRLFPAGAAMLELTVDTVRENSCLARVLDLSITVEPGTTGEILVPVRARGEEPLPWTAPAEDYDTSQPLLLGRATPSSERAPSWRGRVFFQSEYGKARGPTSSSYLFGNAGIDLTYDNPFGRGGRLHFNADAFTRSTNADRSPNVNDARIRFDRISYSFGGTREAPNRWQFGRFLQNEFPELGVIDGVEYSHRLENGSRVGASFGYQPRVLDDFRFENDLQAALFYRHLAGPEGQLALGASYQRTWDKGRPDRDLILGTLDLQAAENWNVWASTWVDLYGSDAVNKDAGLELTQLTAGTTWTNKEGQGGSFGYTQTRWPELLRDLYVAVDPVLLARGKLQRTSLQGWTPLSEHLRARATLEHWADQDDSGAGGEAFLGIRDLLWKRGELGVAVYARDAKFDDLLGLRLTGFKTTDYGVFRGTIDTASVDGQTFSGNVSDGQTRLRASWDRWIGVAWYISLYVQTVSINTVDTSTLGFHLQWSL